MKSTLLTLFIGLFGMTSFAQSLIALESGASTTFFSNLEDAFTAAVDGDIVYLPGGSFTPAGSTLILNKNLDIFGAGHYPDSTVATGQTIINGSLKVLSNASGASIQGIYFTGNVNFGTDVSNNTVNGFSFSRNYVAGTFSLSYDNGSLNATTQNINLSENVFKAAVFLANAINLNISKNIFQDYVAYTNGQVQFSNNIFLLQANYTCSSQPTFHNINGALFYNNIVNNIGCSGLYAGTFTGNAFYNNMFSANVTFPYVGNAGTANISSVDINNIYTVHTTSTFNYLNDYRLIAGCVGVNAGTDGTDIGLYGTAFPYKDGAVPANPHVSNKSIAPQTNSQGELNINITVGAQEY